MVKVTTSIKIDNEKREIAKRKGLILSDILDKALDFYLGLELKESTQLQKDKEEILNNLEVLEIEKDKFLKDHETKLQELEEDKNRYINDYETQKLELNYNLKNIEDSLASAIIEDKEEIRRNEYNIILRMALKSGGVDPRDNKLMDAIEGFADKYEMSDEEFIQLQRDINDYVLNNW